VEHAEARLDLADGRRARPVSPHKSFGSWNTLRHVSTSPTVAAHVQGAFAHVAGSASTENLAPFRHS